MTTVAEFNREIAALESTWNGLDQAPAVEISRLKYDRAMRIRETTGCCGESYICVAGYSVLGEDFRPVVVEIFQIIKCHHTHQPCPVMQLRQMVELFSLLNGGPKNVQCVRAKLVD